MIKKKYEIIPNFIPPAPKHKKDKNLGDYFFFAGMLEKHKGIFNLLKAFKNSEKKLVIAGQGSLQGFVENQILKKEYKNVKYVGWVSGNQIYSYYKNALSFILPSLGAENCPMTILESFSVGTPAMGSNCGGIPEIIEKVDKRLVLKYNDVADIKEKIQNFNSSLYERRKIVDVFSKYYSTENYLKKYMNIIDTL